ncbi:MAG: hypothetical protein AAGG68_30910, partial [Bacteroidota bacterium]
AYWEKELEAFHIESKVKNQIIRSVFEEEFKFSPVLYIYDYAAKDLKKGITKEIFLNENLQVDPSIKFEGEDFLVAAEGRNESAAEGIYIHHSNMNRLQDRYLNFVKLNTIGYLFNSIFSSDSASKRMYEAAVQKLNRKFYKSKLIVE